MKKVNKAYKVIINKREAGRHRGCGAFGFGRGKQRSSETPF
jgi:hypothetical protein